MRARIGEGKRKSGKGRQDTKQKREWGETEGKHRETGGGGPSPEGYIGSNKPERTEGSPPALDHNSGSQVSQFLRRGPPEAVISRRFCLCYGGYGPLRTGGKRCAFSQEKHTQREILHPVSGSSGVLDLHKKQKQNSSVSR